MKPILPTSNQHGDNDGNKVRCRGGQQTPRQRWNHAGKTLRKTKEIANDIFDNTGPHDAATFNKLLKNIVDYLQLQHGSDVSEAVRTMMPTTITIPATPTPQPDPTNPGNVIPVSKINTYIWKWESTKASDPKDKYDENMAKAYIIVYNQCSTTLKNDLKSTDKFSLIRQNQDVLDLLRLIQGLCCSYHAKIQSVMVTVASHKHLYTHYQKDGVDNHTYHREFMAHVETIKTYGGLGAIGIVPTFLEKMLKDMATTGTIQDASNPSDAECALAIKAVCEEYLGALMLSNVNKDKFGPLRTNLKNQFCFGEDCYPKSVDQCLTLLSCWGGTSTQASPSPCMLRAAAVA